MGYLFEDEFVIWYFVVIYVDVVNWKDEVFWV